MWLREMTEDVTLTASSHQPMMLMMLAIHSRVSAAQHTTADSVTDIRAIRQNDAPCLAPDRAFPIIAARLRMKLSPDSIH